VRRPCACIEVAACAASAVGAQKPAAAAAALGQRAISLLDEQQAPAPWRLLSETAQASVRIGDGAAADTLLERGVASLEEQRKAGVVVDPVVAGFLIYEQAWRLVTRGELDRAQSLFEEAAQLATETRNESAMITSDMQAMLPHDRNPL
jgi:hypothetical protein